MNSTQTTGVPAPSKGTGEEDQPTTDRSLPADGSGDQLGAEHDAAIDELDGSIPEESVRVRRRSRKTLMVMGLASTATILLAAGAGYLEYRDYSARAADTARGQSVQAATDGAIALLSYGPDDVEAKLTAAQDRLSGSFRDSYASLTKTVVIPGAKQQRISATATVPAAASVSASSQDAEVVVFVNQSTIIGNGAPTETESVVDVTLDKIGNRWLITGFDPK